MTALPSKGDLNGSSSGHNQGVFKAAIGGLRDFLAGLLGTDGTQASALAALKVLDPQAVYNLSSVFTVGSNALTCTIKDRAGADLSATNPAFVGQRSATAGAGGFNLRAMTANVALTISAGSTLGHANGVVGKIYWYLLDNAGAQVLAACGSFKGFSGIYSTTAEGGAGAADSDSVLYAVGAHSNLPGRLIAVTTDSQTTAGTWVNVPSQVDLIPQALDRRGRVIPRASNTVLGRDNHRDTINATATYTQTLEAAATLGEGWFTDFIVNSGATLTLDPNGSEQVDGATTKVVVGPAQGRLVCNGTLFRTIGFASPLTDISPGIKQGLALSNNTTDATNDIDIAAGKAVDSTAAVVMALASTMVKRLDANWAAGTNQGGRYSGAAIANTTYHVWLVAKAGGVDVDVYIAPSAVAATVLGWLQAETGGGSYLYLWRIGSIIRASAAIRQFRQFRDQFLWDNLGALDLDATSSTSAALVTLSVPSGRKVRALMNVFDTNATAGTQWYLSDPDVSDVVPSITAWPLGSAGAPINGAAGRTQVQVTTNTSAQIRHRNTRSDSTLRIATMGWIDSEIYGA